MTYSFKCKNERCANYDRETTKSCTIAARDEQTCDECGKILTRVFCAPGIRTFSDGYKG